MTSIQLIVVGWSYYVHKVILHTESHDTSFNIVLLIVSVSFELGHESEVEIFNFRPKPVHNFNKDHDL